MEVRLEVLAQRPADADGCPTCGCGDWQLIGALSASTGAEVAHS